MSKLLIATTPTSASPTPQPIINAYDSLYSSEEITKIKNAYSTSKTYTSQNYNEKARIDALAQPFIDAVDKSYWRWTQVTLTNNEVPDSRSAVNFSFVTIGQLKNAGFVAWATDNSSLKTTIKNELIAQSEIALTNLSNPAWVQGRYGDRDLIFGVGKWYSSLITTFLYVESAFSLEEKISFTSYIEEAALFIGREINLSFNPLLQGRNVDNNTSPPYTIVGVGTTDSIFTYKTALNVQTNRTTTLMRRYNNRRVAYMGNVMLLTYLITNNQYLRNTCEMLVKETLTYGWFADGSYNEFHRSDAVRSSITGMGYTSATMGFCNFVAWLFWRKDNDTTLYNYSTSLGANNTDGGAKSLVWATKEYVKYFNGTYERYKYNDTIEADNLMDGRSGNQRIITDALWMAIPLYDYFSEDTDLQSQIVRSTSDYTNVTWTTNNVSNFWAGDVNAFSLISYTFASVFLEIYELNL